jgi:hypothetical protein
MKPLSQLFKFIVSMGLTLQAHASVSEIKGFELKTCNEKNKCLILFTETATSGSFTQLMTFNKFTLDISENNKHRKIEGAFGYLDLDLNKITVTQNSGREIEFSLKDLSEQEFN